MNRTVSYILLGIYSLTATLALAEDGSFSTLAYNVAGLPQGISSAVGDRAAATELISCYVKSFDFVNVQEDFNYHAALYDSCDDHPYRSPTSGGMGIGSGLNSLSRFPYMDWQRVGWDDCNGVDCLTPKGFTLARTRLAEGVYVDIYNLHTQAQVEEADLDARRKNLLQLLSFIEDNSAGNAIIVMGDTNTRYTRAGDNIRQFLRHGFSDVWISRVRNGAVPAKNSTALVCDPPVTSSECEVVDKVLVRDNGFVGLYAMDYRVAEDAVDADGNDLSDHRAIAVNWQYATADDRRLSDQVGGPHGTAFNDVSLLPASAVVHELKLRTGTRVDRVETVLSNGYPFAHGGTGGDEQTLTLADGEYLTSAYLCTGKYNDNTRVFSARFETSDGRGLSGGTETSDCATYAAPDGWQIVAFHGRSGDEIDKLGVVYAPVTSIVPASATALRIVNQQSGHCLDIEDAVMADGGNVIQMTCNDSASQRWSYDEVSGLIRSMRDPHYCLDNSGSYADGANITISSCNGSSDQRFEFDLATGKIAMRNYPTQVVDISSDQSGANVQTWSFSGDSNQFWSMQR
ncbi:MAG: ricin-type beta-trefoil lectin domain protein [Chromatiales bacterium]